MALQYLHQSFRSGHGLYGFGRVSPDLKHHSGVAMEFLWQRQGILFSEQGVLSKYT
jgi:hypothetical protein